MTDPDFKIEEILDTDTMEVRFVIYRMGSNPDFATKKRFNCLTNAVEAVRKLRKYKERIFHYVED